MQISQFPCPHCSTTLRIRDRSFLNRIIDCPDCGRKLKIVSDGPKRLTAMPLSEDEISEDATVPPTAENAGTPSGRSTASLSSAAAHTMAATATTAVSPKSPRKKRGNKKRRQAAKKRGAAAHDVPTTEKADRPTRNGKRKRPAAGLKDKLPLPVSAGSPWTALWKNPVAVSWLAAVIAAGALFGVVWLRSPSGVAPRSVSPETSAEEKSPLKSVAGEGEDPQKINRPALAAKGPLTAPLPSPLRREPPARKPKGQPKPPVKEPPRRVQPVGNPVAARKPLNLGEREPPINFTAALSQKVLLFENTQGAPLRDLLDEVQELAGVPFDYAEALLRAKPSPLARRVSVKLENVTVREILVHLLRPARLTYTIERRALRIAPAKGFPPAPGENGNPEPPGKTPPGVPGSVRNIPGENEKKPNR